MNINTLVKDFNTEDLISSLASLLIEKKNMEAFLSIQQFIHNCLRTISREGVSSSNKKVSNIHQIIKHINTCKETQSIRLQQDPAEELFSDNILFHGGNYTVFPGITSSGVYIVDLLTSTLLADNDDLPIQKNILTYKVLVLLKLSNYIAEKANVSCWESFSESQNPERQIFLPLDYNKSRKAVFFSETELSKILSKNEILELNKIALHIDEYPDVDYDPSSCILSIRPIIKVQNNIVVADPTGIVSSIRNIILQEIFNHNIPIEDFIHQMKKVATAKASTSFRFLGFEKIKNDFLNKNTPIYLSELLFAIDSKRICYVQIFCDPLKEYNSNIAFDYYDSKNEFEYLEKRHQEVYENIILKDFNEQSILHLTILVPLGRSMAGGFNYLPPKTYSFSLGACDLDTIAGLRLNDKYILWKFSEALEILRKNKVQIFPFSHLDMFQCFLDKHQSFYMSDDQKPTFLVVQGDFGRIARERKAKKEQKQILYHFSHTLHPVIKKHTDGNIPIYINLNSSKDEYQEVVKTDYANIWCSIDEKLEGFPVPEFTEALSYWIWQISQSSSLKLLSSHVKITFSKDFINSYKNHDLPLLSISRQSLIPFNDFHQYIKSIVEQPEINLEIQKDSLSLLFYNKNEFDRCLVKALIALYSGLGGENLSEEFINSEVERIAPYGYKKLMMFQSSLTNPYILQFPLPEKVKVSSYFNGKDLDELGNQIKNKIFNNNAIYGLLNTDQRSELFKLAKEFYLGKLNNLIQKYEKQYLLSTLLNLNENQLFASEIENLHFLTSIECYFSIHEKIEKEKESSNITQSTALTTRFLIEYVHSTNITGKQTIENLELEEILSIAYQYISWGQASDEVRCKVYDHQYTYLKSERIGVTDGKDSGMMNYSHHKIEEDFIDRYSKANQIDEKTLAILDQTEFEKAFKDEFELEYEIFNGVCAYLIEKSHDQNKNIFTINELLDSKNEFSEKDITKTLNILTLRQRSNWDTIPEEYEAHEIYPWRFKRRLSCLMKPILELNQLDQLCFLIYPNTLYKSIEYILYNLKNAMFSNDIFKSKAMRSYCGEVARILGENFEKEVANWLDNIKSETIVIHRAVEIGPNHRFKNQENLGDIDILLINLSRKEIVIIELKAIGGAKTPVEISSEIVKHFQNNNPKKRTSLEKHMARFNWAVQNSSSIIKEFNLPINNYKFHHAFLTDSLIPSVFLKSLPKNIGSFSTLKWQKYSELRKIYKM